MLQIHLSWGGAQLHTFRPQLAKRLDRQSAHACTHVLCSAEHSLTLHTKPVVFHIPTRHTKAPSEALPAAHYQGIVTTLVGGYHAEQATRPKRNAQVLQGVSTDRPKLPRVAAQFPRANGLIRAGPPHGRRGVKRALLSQPPRVGLFSAGNRQSPSKHLLSPSPSQAAHFAT